MIIHTASNLNKVIRQDSSLSDLLAFRKYETL
jgi:hypothetical protein